MVLDLPSGHKTHLVVVASQPDDSSVYAGLTGPLELDWKGQSNVGIQSPSKEQSRGHEEDHI